MRTFLRDEAAPQHGDELAGECTSDTEALSERELAVLRRLASLDDYAQLASELYISRNTLKTHLQHIYRKLGAHSRLQAVLRANELGMLET